MYKDGIYKEVPERLISEYKELGFKVLNEQPKPTLEDEEIEDEEPTLEDLKEEADLLGIDYAPNISRSKLLQKINKKKAEN